MFKIVKYFGWIKKIDFNVRWMLLVLQDCCLPKNTKAFLLLHRLMYSCIILKTTECGDATIWLCQKQMK